MFFIGFQIKDAKKTDDPLFDVATAFQLLYSKEKRKQTVKLIKIYLKAQKFQKIK